MPVQRFPQLLNVIQQRFIAAAIGNRCDCGVFALDRAFFLTLPPDWILRGGGATQSPEIEPDDPLYGATAPKEGASA
ncbi:Uncharacterised protein [Acetobacterium wieringae]|nr:Uncharacterised protein [Acetobacterium wieringae]